MEHDGKLAGKNFSTPMSNSCSLVRPPGEPAQQEFMMARLIVAHPPVAEPARATASEVKHDGSRLI
jgi:hypothetical protein